MQLQIKQRSRTWLIGGLTLLLAGSFLALTTPKKTAAPARMASHAGHGWTAKVNLADALRASRPDTPRLASQAPSGTESRRGARMPSGGRGRWKQLPEFHRQGFEAGKA
ncbi:MAG: hypothetical protein ACK4K6_18505, partial [Pseudarthrobacter sp.]